MPTLYTYTATDLPKPIPDATGASSPYTPSITTSTLVVPANFTIEDIDVAVDITHTFTGDLQVKLFGPAGQVFMLKAQGRGGSGDDMTDTVFDSEATVNDFGNPVPWPITSGAAPFTGRFRPETPLTSLYGTNAAGTWQLEVQDQVKQDIGTLTGFQLRITGTAPLAATISSAKSQLGRKDTALLTFTLSQASANFTTRSVRAIGGTLRNFSGSGTSYTAEFVPQENYKGAATVVIPGNTFTTPGGTANVASALSTPLSVNTLPLPPIRPPLVPTLGIAGTDPKKDNELRNTAGLPNVIPPQGTSTKLPAQPAPGTPCGICGEWKQKPDGTLYCKEAIDCEGQPSPPKKDSREGQPCGKCGEWKRAVNGELYCKEPWNGCGDGPTGRSPKKPANPMPGDPCGNCGEWKEIGGRLVCKEPINGCGDAPLPPPVDPGGPVVPKRQPGTGGVIPNTGTTSTTTKASPTPVFSKPVDSLGGTKNK